jgi:ankyrin repeat protein
MIGRSGKYKDFTDLLSLSGPRAVATPPTSYEYRHVVSYIRPKLFPPAQDLLQSPSFQVLRIRCGKLFSPVNIFATLKKAISTESIRLQPIFLLLDSDMFTTSNLSDSEIYACLSKQILEQEPGLLQSVEHLFPNLEAAVTGVNKVWMERILWMCLRLLLQYPKDVDIYFFIHDSTESAFLGLIDRLVSTLQGTDISLKLIISAETFSQATSIPGMESSETIDLSAMESLEALKRDLEAVVKELVGDRVTKVWERQVIVDQLLSSPSFRQIDSCLSERGSALAPYSTSLFWDAYANTNFGTQMIEYHIHEQGSWILFPVVWILDGLRPFSPQEMDLVLAVEHERDSTFPDSLTFLEVQRMLPGVFSLRRGLVVIPEELRPGYRDLWIKYHPTKRSPHTHLALSCLTAVRGGLKPKPSNSTNAKSPIAEQKSGSEPNGEAGQKMERNLNAKLPPVSSKILEYAATNWLRHYQQSRDDENPKQLDELEKAVESFVGDSDQVSVWLKYLRSPRENAMTADSMLASISPKALQDRFKLNTAEALELSYRLGCMRLSSDAEISGAILVIAAETSNAAFVRQFLEFALPQDDALIRAVAGASSDIRQELLKGREEFFWQNYHAILLSAIALRNRSAVVHLVDHRPSPPEDTGSDTSKSWWPATLPTPLQIASEYGDSDVVAMLLGQGDVWWNLEISSLDSPRFWNALQLAAVHGHADISAKLLDKLHKSGADSHINATNASGFTPLILASSRGHFDVASLLLKRGADVNRASSRGYTALLCAGRYGFRRVVARLLENKDIDLTAKDEARNGILHISILGTNPAVADLTLPALSAIPAGTQSRARRSRVSLNFDSDSDTDSDEEDRPSDESEAVSFDRPNKTGTTPLILALRLGLVSIAEKLLESGANPNVSDSSGSKPLLIAAQLRSVQLVKRLIEGPADLSAIDDDGRTALHLACHYGHKDVVEELRTAFPGMDIDDLWSNIPLETAIRRDQRHIVNALLPHTPEDALQRAFWAAAKYGQPSIIKQLLELGADIDAQDSYSNTALQWATYYDKPRVVRLLLLRRAKMELADIDGVTALIDASRSGAAEPLRLLIEAGASLETKTNSGTSALCLAISCRKPACVKILLQKGAKPEICDNWASYENLLTFAVDLSNPEILRFMLEHYHNGGKSETKSSHLAHAFRLAVRKSKLDMVDVLLDFWDLIGADLGEDGTPLHFAAATGRDSVVERIILHPTKLADVNAPHKKLGTPLQVSAYSTDYPLSKTRVLLQNRADPTRIGGKWGTALNAAALRCHEEVIELLLQYLKPGEANLIGGRYGTAVQSTVARAHRELETLNVLDLLLKAGASVTLEGGLFKTALHAAARRHRLSVVEKLLGQPDVPIHWKDTRDKIGRLPLHLAASHNSWEVVQVLSSDYSKVDTPDNQGRNALHFAAAGGAKDVITKILEDSTTSNLLHSTDCDGWTPLHWACRFVSRTVVDYLIEKGAKRGARTTDENMWTPLQVALFHDQDPLNLRDPGAKAGSDPGPLAPVRYISAICDSCDCVSPPFTTDR